MTTIGLRKNLSQFILLVLLNFFVGGMVGLERTILPLIAEAEFGIASNAAMIAFIATFGITKAFVNLFAGPIADRWGRRNVLLLGWLFGFPVPLIVMAAQSWTMVLCANVLLGVNQALCWSMTVVMKVDLVAPKERGLALGLNEFSGYGGVAVIAGVSGFIASSYNLRPEPFIVGIAVAAVGLALSTFVTDTRAQEALERPKEGIRPLLGEVTRMSRPLAASSLAGLVTNLKDGMLWGLLPLYLKSAGAPVATIGQAVALYPATWAVGQLIFGPLSDRVGRSVLITLGLNLQAFGVVGFILFPGMSGSLVSAAMTGIGTAMVYPTLQAFVSDITPDERRATSLGVYRFWRDGGYAIGALGAGVIADALGMSAAFSIVGSLLMLTSFVVHRR